LLRAIGINVTIFVVAIIPNVKKLKRFLFNWGSWNLWRVTRLLAGLGSLLAGALQRDWLLAGAGVFLMVHVYVNACAACQTSDCELPIKKYDGQV
jgi:hypothetical protein